MIELLNNIISTVFALCYAYQVIYMVVPLIKKQPQNTKGEKPLNHYAVVIAARNEASVIAALIESIQQQHYPQELLDIFVVADNCTDQTAAIARSQGAHVHERYNQKQQGKGYALEFLFDRIFADYGSDQFAAYFVFDADNLLDPNYVAEMHRVFSNGYEIVTGYRNSKNYGDNWISAGYSLNFIRESAYLNESRMALNISGAVSGTGFMFSNTIINKTQGWKYFLLTEDIEFTIKQVLDGQRIGYSATAIFYDEQPVGWKQSWKQRMRWAKGFIQVFQKYGKQLVRGIFTAKQSLSCYDMTFAIMPSFILTATAVVGNLLHLIYSCLSHDVQINLTSIISTSICFYIVLLVVAIIVTLSQWKQIHATSFQKIKYIFTYPIFMATFIPIGIAALFSNVTWEPIEHNSVKRLSEIRKI